MSTKRSPEEILKSIDEPDVDDELERVLAMTPEERRAELEAAGVDVQELHARAEAWSQKAKGHAVEHRKKGPVDEGRAPSLHPARSRRVYALLAATSLAAVAVAVAIYAYVVGSTSPEPAPPALPTPSGSTTAPEPPPSSLPIAMQAAAYRRQGLAACGGHLW
jgi:hypothetical protein